MAMGFEGAAEGAADADVGVEHSVEVTVANVGSVAVGQGMSPEGVQDDAERDLEQDFVPIVSLESGGQAKDTADQVAEVSLVAAADETIGQAKAVSVAISDACPGDNTGDRQNENADDTTSSEQNEADTGHSRERYAQLASDMLEYKDQLPPDLQPTYRIIPTAQGQDVIVTHNAYTGETEKDSTSSGAPGSTPLPHRIAFAVSDPDTKLSVAELPPDSPWLGHANETESSEHELKDIPGVFNALAKAAPDQPAIEGLVQAFGKWLDDTPRTAVEDLTTEERNSHQKSVIKAARSIERNSCAKAIILGTARQLDLAIGRNEEVDVKPALASLSEVMKEHELDKFTHRSSNTNLMMRLVKGEQKPRTADSGWKVGLEAACALSAELPAHGLADNFLFSYAVESGRTLHDTELNEAFHRVLVSERGKDVIASVPDPQAAAERHMGRVLKSYKGDPERHQGNVRALLNEAVRSTDRHTPDRVLIPNLFRLARVVADADSRTQNLPKPTSIKDYALAGEAFLYLSKITRTERSDGAQYEEDRRHAELIGSLAGHISAQRSDEPLTFESFFARPGLSDKQKQEAARRYLGGESPHKIYVHFRRSQRGQEGKEASRWGMKRDGGLLS